MKHNNEIEILEEVTSDELKFFIDIPKEKGQLLNEPIRLTIQNVSKKSFIISSPACWVSSRCHLYNEGENNELPSILIRLSQGCVFIPMPPNSLYSIPYGYSLSYIYTSSLKSGKFKLYFTYHGEVKDKDGNKMKIKGGELKSNVEEIEI